MNTLESNRFTDSWRNLGAAMKRPRAAVVVSAHWYTNATAVTAMPQPRTIHDFYGFPQELFDVEYPAPGEPEVAHLVVDTLEPRWVGMDSDSWGLDHGTWSVTVHMFPEADIPIVQLSINATQPLEYHHELGTRLAPLLDEGIAIIGSGNVVHNLRRVAWDQPDEPFDWNRRFNEAAIVQATEAPEDIAKLAEHPDFAQAVPTPDHFIPFVYFAGVASGAGRKPEVLIDGYAYGSLSMTCFTINRPRGVEVSDATEPSAGRSSEAPPDQTNL